MSVEKCTQFHVLVTTGPLSPGPRSSGPLFMPRPESILLFISPSSNSFFSDPFFNLLKAHKIFSILMLYSKLASICDLFCLW